MDIESKYIGLDFFPGISIETAREFSDTGKAAGMYGI